jgi:hypothetical protein
LQRLTEDIEQHPERAVHDGPERRHYSFNSTAEELTEKPQSEVLSTAYPIGHRRRPVEKISGTDFFGMRALVTRSGSRPTANGFSQRSPLLKRIGD